MRKIGIFYITVTPGFEGPGEYTRIQTMDGRGIYIRLEEVEAKDEATALAMAKPRRGENLMNTHYLPR